MTTNNKFVVSGVMVLTLLSSGLAVAQGSQFVVRNVEHTAGWTSETIRNAVPLQVFPEPPPSIGPTSPCGPGPFQSNEAQTATSWEQQFRQVVEKQGEGEVKIFMGRAPTRGRTPDDINVLKRVLFEVDDFSEDAAPAGVVGSTTSKGPSVITLDVGTDRGLLPGAHFSSSRVSVFGRLDPPFQTNNFTIAQTTGIAELFFPHSTIGWLLGTDPRDNSGFRCTASVVGRRLILTAGHCVHAGDAPLSDPNGGTLFEDFLFIPAPFLELNEDLNPNSGSDFSTYFGFWRGETAMVSPIWSTGRGEAPNAADYGLIQLEDREVDGGVLVIGEDITGWLGLRTGGLTPNHVHQVGYSSNHDVRELTGFTNPDSAVMHQVAASAAFPGGENTVVYGSDMGPGSSGSPLIQNFPGNSFSRRDGFNDIDSVASIDNVVTGVLSYGCAIIAPEPDEFVNQTIKRIGSVNLDSNFAALYEAMCASREGNCATTSLPSPPAL